MCFLSVTPVGQQRTANTFFMILGGSFQSRLLEKRLGSRRGQVMSQLCGSSLGKRGHLWDDVGFWERDAGLGGRFQEGGGL